MGIDAGIATAADFDAASQKHANAFWLWLVVAGLVYTFLSGGQLFQPCSLFGLLSQVLVLQKRLLIFEMAPIEFLIQIMGPQMEM